MLNQRRQLYTRVWQFADGLLFALASWVAYLVRAYASTIRPELHVLEPFTIYLWIIPASAVLGPWVLAVNGFYDPPRPTTRLTAVFVLLRSGILTSVGLILLLFFTREQLARSVIVLIGGIGGAFVYLRHELTSWLDARNLAQTRRRVLWVGSTFENNLLR